LWSLKITKLVTLTIWAIYNPEEGLKLLEPISQQISSTIKAVKVSCQMVCQPLKFPREEPAQS
jgi:hypothetical protein